MQPQAQAVSSSGDIVNVDKEVSLIVVRASGGSAFARVSEAHVAASVTVGSFEIEDLLVGARCSALGYLARSFQTGNPLCLGQYTPWRTCVNRTRVPHLVRRPWQKHQPELGFQRCQLSA